MAISNGQIASAGLLGLAVGDALGVPVEFQSRQQLRGNPVTGMRGFGTHRQLPGTWSDDTSLTLCLAASICECGIDYDDQSRRFVAWMRQGEWTPHGRVFDIGNATSEAIFRLAAGTNPTEAGPTNERSNGNGSLMRILPIAIYLAYASTAERIDVAMTSSRLTHGHPRCQLACAYFVEVAAAVIRGVAIGEALVWAREAIRPLMASGFPAEVTNFARLFSADFALLTEANLSGSGYVIHCLESSLWCALNAETYAAGVLRAVNLGDDTDTTGAVTGGLLGLRFGEAVIPNEWVQQLARREDILALGERFQQVCQRRWEIDR